MTPDCEGRYVLWGRRFCVCKPPSKLSGVGGINLNKIVACAKSEIRGWNEIPLTKTDFQNFCEARGIFVFIAEFKWEGMYLIRRGVPVIYLRQSLPESQRLLIGWHEAGHHLFHVPDIHFYGSPLIDVIEYEAHMIATCAIYPRPLVGDRDYESHLLKRGFLSDVIRMRRRLLAELGI